jgi:hypothetical protein
MAESIVAIGITKEDHRLKKEQLRMKHEAEASIFDTRKELARQQKESDKERAAEELEASKAKSAYLKKVSI